MRIGRTADGRSLRVGAGASTAALISTSGFRVSLPSVGAPGSSATRTWLVVAAGALAALLIAVLLGAGLRRLRGRPVAA
jgi:ABC-type branched-subunit amino acid transport system permease subunit